MTAELHEELTDPHAEQLDHGAAASRPLKSRVSEAQPRGAKIRGNRPVAHSDAASHFTSGSEQEAIN